MTSFKPASFVIVSCVIVGVSLGARVASADPVTLATVTNSLGGFERAPDVSLVRSWGAAGATHLLSIANDATAPLHVRVRAVHALRVHGGSAPVRAFLRALAAVPAQNLFVLRASLDALVEGFYDVVEVARYLYDARTDVRDGAAWSLSTSRDPGARAALAARLAVETDPTVRLTITTALRGDPATPTGPAAPAGSVTTVTSRTTTRALGR